MSFFFTILDDSLRPQGSRDPLGIEYLWSSVGRRLVGNLTTITTNLDNFVVALVGFHLCRDEPRGVVDWEAFERYEQLTARARDQLSLPGVIGVRRIAKSRDFPIHLGSNPAARILDNQRQAGLWGLYSTALAGAGLISDARWPTAKGDELAARFLRGAPNSAWELAVDKTRRTLDASHLQAAQQWIQSILGKQAEREELAKCLLGGSGQHAEWQHEVFRQGMAFLKDRKEPPSPREFLAWLTTASPTLNDFATRILHFDQALALSSVTFNWLLGCHGRSKMEVAAGLAQMRRWPYGDQPIPDFSAEIANEEWSRRANGLASFCNAMKEGKWLAAIDALFAHHEQVATTRGGAAWCYWENDRVKVVMSTTPGTLPAQTEIAAKGFESWMRAQTFGFFLGSFLAILHQSGLAGKNP